MLRVPCSLHFSHAGLHASSIKLADDVLEDTRSVSELCRLCIRRCLGDNPVDTRALGEFYRRQIMCASGRVRPFMDN